MANRGLSYMLYAKTDENAEKYDEIKNLFGAKSSKFKPNMSEAQEYAENMLWIEDSAIASGTLTIVLADEDLQTKAELLGYEYSEESGLEAVSDAQKPFFGFGQIVETKGRDGKIKYKAEFFNKISFKPYEMSSETRKDTITYSGPTLEATVYVTKDGKIYKQHEHETFEAAKTALRGWFPQE